MKIVLLCGGRGVIDPESRLRIPKGMVILGDRPLIWHIMKTFSTYGYNEFVLALGEGGQHIRSYFLDYSSQLQDIEISTGSGAVKSLNNIPREDWHIKFVDTGRNAQTGSRLARCRRYIEGGSFIISYSDCLCNVNILNLLAYHQAQGKIITVTGVQPPSRLGTFFTEDDRVTGYSSTTNLVGKGGFINGGYMIAESSLLEYLTPFAECNLENEVFTQLAKEGQVVVYPHDGYWQAIDTERDVIYLNELYKTNQRPWLPEPLNFAESGNKKLI
jgi:glucose-1-phosphate cytidylyltransferase